MRRVTVRSSNGVPTAKLWRISVSEGRRRAPAARHRRATSHQATPPSSSSAKARARPTPPSPVPKPNTKAMFSARLTAALPINSARGVRASDNPRKVPVAASMTSIPGRPGRDHRKYAVASDRTVPVAPSPEASQGAATQATVLRAMPSTNANHIACTPSSKPRVRLPAPSCRETTEVDP